MTNNINLFVRFFILLLVGCHTPPIDSDQTAIELEEPRIDLISDQQALITLEQLNADTNPSIWEQYFIQRGAEAIWNILQQRQESLNINFEGLAAPILYTNRQREEIVAGIVQYLVSYRVPIKNLRLGWDTISNNRKGLTSSLTGLVELSSLEMLNLMDNSLEELSPGIDKLTNLQDLSISTNHFSVLSPGLFSIPSLRRLDLSINNLTAIPTEIGQLTNLEKLDLADNKLQILSAEVGRLTNLKELNLSFNLLTVLPCEIGSLTKLESLDLTNNSLVELPVGIKNLSNLKYLDISENQLTKLPSSIISQFNNRLRDRRNKISGNSWLTIRDCRPIDKEALKKHAYQIFPHSLLTLCMEFVEKYIAQHPEQQEAIEKALPYELSRAERQKQLKEKDIFIAGKNIVFFKRMNFKIIPFYLDYTLRNYQDINNMISEMEHKRLYQVIDPID